MAHKEHKSWDTSGWIWMISSIIILASTYVSAERILNLDLSMLNGTSNSESHYFHKIAKFVWQSDDSGYHHVWPEMKFGWELVFGSIVGFLGAAFGSVGGIGGGGFFVPMLTLIIGFDQKSSTAISKCMIMGAAVSTVCYNLRLRHPTLDLPIIDYDLALLIQPMLMLGISIGVSFNVIFPDWLVTVLLIIVFLGTSTKALIKGVETWKKETLLKKESTMRLQFNVSEHVEYNPLPDCRSNSTPEMLNEVPEPKVSIIENIYWKEFGFLVFVWVAYLCLQIWKNYTATCSILYWLLNLLQIPVSLGVSAYEAVSLYKGRRVIGSQGDAGTNFTAVQLILYCFVGIAAGVIGGLLGIGGGSLMGPLFLELGIHPQVSSATSTFAMVFSSSMSVIEYYLLKRFPVPYAVYFMGVATISAFVGQYMVGRLVLFLGRSSIIIFILAFTIFISTFTLGGVGIANMIERIEEHEYMGFLNLCDFDA